MEEMQFLDIRGVIYLCLEYQCLPSVKNLFDIYPFPTLDDYMLMHTVRYMDFRKPVDIVVGQILNYLPTSVNIAKAEEFCNIFRSVASDYMEHVPRGFGRTIDEKSMLHVAKKTMVCDECGEEIECGDDVFIRTEPVRAIRHPKCNATTRWKCEYSQVNYYNKEIEYFEKLFSKQENANYILDKSLTHRSFIKMGYVTDRYGKIIRLPRFSEFVLKYVSGVSDYELMMEFRPYHVYIQFLLNMKGVSNEKINDMGGFKYLLREKIGSWKYPEICNSIENTSYSELFFDEPIYKEVDIEVKRVVYTAVIKRMLDDEKILIGDCKVIRNGEERTFSVNCDDGSDILITADEIGVFCTDDETSEPISEYFDLSEKSEQYLDYIKMFEASQ